MDPSSAQVVSNRDRVVQNLAGASDRIGNRGFAWNLRDLAAALPGLRPPLRLIAASADRTVPPQQAVHVARQVPGARLIEWPGLGHLAHEEQPALLVRALDDVRAGR